MEKLYKEFVQLLPADASILDIGCGSGRDSFWFEKEGYKVWAYDGSEEVVKYCQPFLYMPLIKDTSTVKLVQYHRFN